MNINRKISKYNFNKGSVSRIKYIVIHYVGALGGAQANCKYYAGQYVGASAHYFVGFNAERRAISTQSAETLIVSVLKCA